MSAYVNYLIRGAPSGPLVFSGEPRRKTRSAVAEQAWLAFFPGRKVRRAPSRSRGHSTPYQQTEIPAAATAAGVNLANYTRLAYVFPRNPCSWAGLAYVGGRESWYNNSFNFGTFTREQGHNFGLYYSHNYNCHPQTVSDSGCTVGEYGDLMDTMGSTSGNNHYNAFQKERLGWLGYGSSPPITTVTTSTDR